MTVTATSVSDIVNSHCHTLLKALKAGHSNADVGISAALFYPNDPSVPSFFKFGSAGPGIEITPRTVYAIGSVTKVFTATLAAYLSAQGMIGDLGQTLVGPYLSNPACEQSGVSGPYWSKEQGATFAAFATQTSGMLRESNGPYADQLFAAEPPPCPQIAWWNSKQTGFAGNEGYWIYSNAGFVTLGFAVAAAAAKGGMMGGYPALLKNIITTPVGMPYTFPAGDVPVNAVLAQGYNDKGPVPITDAADLKSTAQDLFTWFAAVYKAMQLQASGVPLTPLQQAIANTASIWIPDPMNPDKQPLPFSMGLGWQIPTIGSAQALVKDGATGKGGCSCWLGLTRYHPSVPPVGIAVLTNQVGVAPDPTGHTILEDILAQN